MKKVIYAMTILVLSTSSDVVWAQKDEGRFGGLLNKIKSKFSKSSKSQESDKPELSMERVMNPPNTPGHTVKNARNAVDLRESDKPELSMEHIVNAPEDTVKNPRHAVDLRESDKPELSMEHIVNAANAQAGSKNF